MKKIRSVKCLFVYFMFSLLCCDWNLSTRRILRFRSSSIGRKFILQKSLNIFIIAQINLLYFKFLAYPGISLFFLKFLGFSLDPHSIRLRHHSYIVCSFCQANKRNSIVFSFAKIKSCNYLCLQVS